MGIQDDYLFKAIGKHQDELKKRFHVESLAIFGSVAKDEATQKSDVDILVRYKTTPGFFGFLDLKRYLEELTGRRVDLVTEGALKRQLREQILREAVRVA